jgi:hypothetical protein
MGQNMGPIPSKPFSLFPAARDGSNDAFIIDFDSAFTRVIRLKLLKIKFYPQR